MSENKKPGRLGRMLWAILAGIIFGLVLATNDFKLREPIWIVLPAFALSFFLQITVHELGHFVFGRLAGYELYSFRVLGFILQKENHRYKLRYQKAVGYGGLCLMFPSPNGNTRGQNMLFFAGGILFNLLAGLVCFLIISYALPEPGFVRVTLYSSLVMSLFMGITNAIPSMNGSNYKTDGKLIWNALQRNESYKFQQSIYNLSMRSVAGVRPAWLDEPYWEYPDQISDLSQRNTILLMAYYHYLDLGQNDRALSYLQSLEQQLGNSTTTEKESIKTELLYAACTLAPDRAKAEALYAELGKRLSKDRSVASYRVRAAYSWYVLKDADKTSELLIDAYAVADKYVVKGFIPFEKDLLKELTQKVEAVTRITETELA